MGVFGRVKGGFSQRIRRHFRNFRFGWDPLIHVNTLDDIQKINEKYRTKRFFNDVYLFTVFLNTWYLIDGIIQSWGHFDEFRCTPHRMLIKFYTIYTGPLNPADVQYYITHTMTLSMSYMLFFEKYPQLDSFMFVIGDHDDEDKKIYCNKQYFKAHLSHELLAYRKKINWLVQTVDFGFTNQMMGTLFIVAGNYIFIADVELNALQVFSIALSPFYFVYLIQVNMSIVIHFPLTCRYIYMRQRDLVNQLQELARKVSRNSSKRFSYKVWRRYRRTEEDTMELLHDINKYSKYWAKYMTVILPIWLMEICYLSNMFLMAPTWEMRLKGIPLAGFCVPFVFVMYFLFTYCSSMIENNKSLHRHMRMFYDRCRKTNHFEPQELFKMSTMESGNKFFQRACIKFVNGYAINNRVFEGFIAYIGIIYMRIFEEQRAAK